MADKSVRAAVDRITRGHHYFNKYWKSREAPITQHKLYLIEILIVSMNRYFKLILTKDKSEDQIMKIPHLSYLFHLLIGLGWIKFYPLPRVSPSFKYRKVREGMIKDLYFLQQFDKWEQSPSYYMFEPKFNEIYSNLTYELSQIK